MSELPEKKRLRRARAKARDILLGSNHVVLPVDSSLFDFLFMRKREIRLINVTLNELSKSQEKEIRNFCCAEICSKEIWTKMESSEVFVIKEVS